MSSATTPAVRRLQTRDLFVLARIISKSTDELQERIEGVLNRKLERDQEAILLGLVVFESGIRQAATELQGWLASMADPELSEEDFGQLPLDAPLEMVEKIMEQEQESLPGFLVKLQALMAKGQSLFSVTSSSSGTDGHPITSSDSPPDDSGN